MPDAIHTDCAKCSEKQKEGSKKIMRHLIDNKPEWWKQLEAKYDKDGTYKKKYQDEKDANLKIWSAWGFPMLVKEAVLVACEYFLFVYK